MNDAADNTQAEPAPQFWDDPVYRYVSRKHRDALDAGDDGEAARFDALMQQIANGAMSDDVHAQLEADAKADRQERKRERKRESKSHPRPPAAERDEATINVAELKRRIFNPGVSRENVIKALEALPAAERKATLAGLPPGLRRKLGDYLTHKGH